MMSDEVLSNRRHDCVLARRLATVARHGLQDTHRYRGTTARKSAQPRSNR
jgi:hypothetical protein